MNLENLSLAEIVTSRPAAAAIFENLHLDFCCKGKQKLSEALLNDQDKLAEVKVRLENVFKTVDHSQPDFNSYSLNGLINHIVKVHHQYVKESMPVIQHHLKKIVAKHGDHFPFMKEIDEIFGEVKCDFEQHLIKEENILFPKIAAMETNFDFSELPNLKSIIGVMEKEHEFAGSALEEIRMLSNDYTAPANTCVTFKVCMEELKMFEADLHKHVHLENNILFHRIMAMQNDSNHNSCSRAF